jgi:hypothetical protein
VIGGGAQLDREETFLHEAAAPGRVAELFVVAADDVEPAGAGAREHARPRGAVDDGDAEALRQNASPREVRGLGPVTCGDGDAANEVANVTGHGGHGIEQVQFVVN